MNLYGLAAGLVSYANPLQQVSVRASTGYATAASGVRTSTYALPVVLPAQVQELTQGELRQIESLNIQGVQRSVYFTGAAAGAVRFSRRGGDVITLLTDNTVWLTTAVLEEWPDWVKVSITLQLGS